MAFSSDYTIGQCKCNCRQVSSEDVPLKYWNESLRQIWQIYYFGYHVSQCITEWCANRF